MGIDNVAKRSSVYWPCDAMLVISWVLYGTTLFLTDWRCFLSSYGGALLVLAATVFASWHRNVPRVALCVASFVVPLFLDAFLTSLVILRHHPMLVR